LILTILIYSLLHGTLLAKEQAVSKTLWKDIIDIE